jgi:hypothetical protein
MRDMNTVFIGGPFKGMIDPGTGSIIPEYRSRYELLAAFFTQAGWLVHNAHRSEGWGLNTVPDRACTERDFQWMHDCDLFIAFPGSPASPGTHVEIGWATAMAKPTILLLEAMESYAALVTGLSSIALIEYVRFSDLDEALSGISTAVDSLARATGASWALSPVSGGTHGRS